jgi:hypothetical protein
MRHLPILFLVTFFIIPFPASAQDDPNCGGHLQPCCYGNHRGLLTPTPSQNTRCDDPTFKCVLTIDTTNPLVCCDPNICCEPTPIPDCPALLSYYEARWCNNNNGVSTSLGCINFNTPLSFISQLLPWLIGIGGLIALLAIVYAGFLITTSGGDPKKVAAGRELIIAILIGLGFIVLSILLLNFIGADILHLEGMGFNIN